MKKEKLILKHDEIERFDQMAAGAQDVVHDTVNFLRQRTTELNGFTADRNSLRGLGGMFAGLLADPHQEKDKDKRIQLIKDRATATAEFCQLVTRARNKDEDAIFELNAMWSETIDITIRAKSNFLSFYRPVTLADNETIKYTHTYKTEVDVRYTSQDGGPRTRKAVAPKKNSYYELEELWTDEVEYPLRDINLGSSIGEMAQKTFDLAFEMEAKLNRIAKAHFLTLIGNFTTTGTKINRTWYKTTDVDEANLPTTNLLACNDVANSPTTLFRLDAIRKVMKYCQQWADVWGTPITPTGLIYVPSLDSTDLSLECTPTGAKSAIVAERIADGNYLRFDWFDKTWTLVPDATLAPGTCFPVLSQPVGDFFTKPSQDASYVETFVKKNLERRSAMKGIQIISPQPKLVNAVKCVYRTAA